MRDSKVKHWNVHDWMAHSGIWCGPDRRELARDECIAESEMGGLWSAKVLLGEHRNLPPCPKHGEYDCIPAATARRLQQERLEMKRRRSENEQRVKNQDGSWRDPYGPVGRDADGNWRGPFGPSYAYGSSGKPGRSGAVVACVLALLAFIWWVMR